MRLSGHVEVDGAAFGGHVRPANARKDRVDRRLLRNRSGKRRVVVALRQRGGSTLTRTFLREAEGVGFARERIAPRIDDLGPMKSPIGTVSSRGSMFTASTIPTPTAATASTPICAPSVLTI